MAKKIFLTYLVFLLVLAGCAIGGNDLERRIDKLEQDIKDIKQDVGNLKNDLAVSNQEDGITLYFIKEAEGDFFLSAEKRQLPAAERTPIRALEELQKGPGPGSSLQPVIPEGTELLSFKIDNNTAVVNFNSAFMRNMNAGARLEDLILSAIVNTLTEFPEIKNVQFLIEGQKVETIGGHIETYEPLTRNEKVIK